MKPPPPCLGRGPAPPVLLLPSTGQGLSVGTLAVRPSVLRKGYLQFQWGSPGKEGLRCSASPQRAPLAAPASGDPPLTREWHLLG